MPGYSKSYPKYLRHTPFIQVKQCSRLLQTMKMMTAIIIMMVKNANFKKLSYSSHFKNDYLIPIS